MVVEWQRAEIELEPLGVGSLIDIPRFLCVSNPPWGFCWNMVLLTGFTSMFDISGLEHKHIFLCAWLSPWVTA